jgi:hypothetical protein
LADLSHIGRSRALLDIGARVSPSLLLDLLGRHHGRWSMADVRALLDAGTQAIGLGCRYG